MNTLEIIRQIEADPALAAQLRSVLLGDAFLRLPEQVAANTAAIASLTEQVAANTAAIAILTEQVAKLAVALEHIEHRVARLEGWQLEHRIRSNLVRYFSGHFRQVDIVESNALEEMIEQLHRRSPLLPADSQRLYHTDVIAQARSVSGNERMTIVGEVSVTLHLDDVTRAHESAEIVSSRGRRAVAVALGADLGGGEVAAEAEKRGVLLIRAA